MFGGGYQGQVEQSDRKTISHALHLRLSQKKNLPKERAFRLGWRFSRKKILKATHPGPNTFQDLCKEGMDIAGEILSL